VGEVLLSFESYEEDNTEKIETTSMELAENPMLKIKKQRRKNALKLSIAPAIEVDTSLGGRRVVGVLERLTEIRGLPESITMDNGPEIAGRAPDEWAYRKGVKLNFIRPGKPIKNSLAESFINRLRDKCLNTNWFTNLRHAREIIEDWRIDYNEGRPYCSLGGLTSREYVENTVKTPTAVGL
jgi:hypothetical protein